MKYLYQIFKARKTNSVKVDIDQPTKVKMMSKAHLDKYRNNKTHTYWGGYFEEKSVVFEVPQDGTWAIVVEKGTYLNPLEVNASVALIEKGSEPATPLPDANGVLQEVIATPAIEAIEENATTAENEGDEEEKTEA